ncbi:MAG: CHAT domain-containing protein, partial [Anaerolineae bacterium]
MLNNYTDILIRIRTWDESTGAYPVEAALDDGSRFRDGELRLDMPALLRDELDPELYGRRLFDALFAGPIRRAYDKVTGRAEAEAGGRLRVHLRIDEGAAELHALPWERLYHRHKGQWVPLATSTRTPFSRYTGLGMREPAPITQRPVRLLIAISNPRDLPQGLPPIDVEREVENLRRALGNLRETGLIQVTLLPGRTGLSPELRGQLVRGGYQIQDGVTSLDNILRELPACHALHFLGHGRFLRQHKRGEGTAALYLERADGKWQAVTDEELAPKLTAADPVPHLVFLAACESARRDDEDRHPFVGLGPKLVQAGVPAVVAMQKRVPMDLARQLTGDFYRQLLEHGVVDLALNQARLLLFDHDRTDWAIPVLFMRLRDGRLFATEHSQLTVDHSQFTILSAPPPPDSFAGRTGQLAALTRQVLAGTDVAISAAVQGMGGVGKTTLAQKLGRDLAGHFPGGVLWLEVGRQATDTGVVSRLALQLGLELKEEPRLDQRAAIVQAELARRGRLLVVLDDLWDVDLGRWLSDQVLPPDRVLLITSRDLALCRALCNHVERLDVLPEAEALELLSNILGPLDGHAEAARQVIRLVEGLPLALDLAARLCDNGADDLPWLVRRLEGRPALDILKLEG